VSALVASNIALPNIDYLAILPELVLLGGALVIMLATSLVRGGINRTMATSLTVLFAAGSLATSLVQWSRVSAQGATTTIAHAISLDGFSAFFGITVSCALLLSTLIGADYLEREGITTPEYHILALIAASGAIMMGQANDLIIVFLALEILSIALYVLVAFNPLRGESGEAAIKYYVLGGFSSAIFVYGIALVYGATGSTNLGQIANFFTQNQLIHSGLFDAGMALLLVGFAFKVAAVPFHVWTPDVYQGAPSPITGFMAAVAKVGGFAALIRVFVAAMSSQSATWKPIIYALAVATLLLGTVVALVQRDVKRMLAYSSISHAGYILVGVEVGTLAGTSAALYYLFTYAIVTVGAFGVVTLLGGPGDTEHDLTRYRGLARRQPWLGAAFVVFLLAQAGIPFTTGFLAKLGVVSAAIQGGSWPLALIAMVAAAIGVAFYLRLVVMVVLPEGSVEDDASSPASAVNPGTAGAQRTLLLEEAGVDQEASAPVRVPALTAISLGLAAVVTVFFGIIPGPLLDFAHAAALLFQA
jgi:NADH-quinone oxidoreductase subunit N